MRTLIADDHALFRDSLRSLLEAREYEVVAEAGDGEAAIQRAWETKPDLVLMDLAMPGGMDGLTATKRLTGELPDIRVVILTASDDEENLFEAIKSGAKGYLIKDLEANRFFELLDGITRGEPALTPSLAGKLLDEFARQPRGSRDDLDALTEREQEVLEQMVQGITTNRRLANVMGVSENTIKFHVRNILDKLHLHNRAQVVGYALRHHIVDPDQ